MTVAHQVFISYSQKDGDIAASLASKLEDAGLKCFMADRSILAAAQWEPKLREAMLDADSVLLLMTPRSKESLWVAAEAGAAWVLNKPLIPVLMFVDAQELFEPVRKYQARRAETTEQIDTLVRELRDLSIAPLWAPNTKPLQGRGSTSTVVLPESFVSPASWDTLLKVGEWTRDADSSAILGEGMSRYLLSSRIYGPNPLTVRCRLTFLELRPENQIDAVNAGIVVGWRVPRRARQYHHILFTGTRLLLEHIGSRDGDEYIDYQHIDEGVPFQLEANRPYDLVVHVASTVLQVHCDGREVYFVSLAQSVPAGRVGLRPWRSRMKCERFDVATDEASVSGRGHR